MCWNGYSFSIPPKIAHNFYLGESETDKTDLISGPKKVGIGQGVYLTHKLHDGIKKTPLWIINNDMPSGNWGKWAISVELSEICRRILIFGINHSTSSTNILSPSLICLLALYSMMVHGGLHLEVSKISLLNISALNLLFKLLYSANWVQLSHKGTPFILNILQCGWQPTSFKM